MFKEIFNDTSLRIATVNYGLYKTGLSEVFTQLACWAPVLPSVSAIAATATLAPALVKYAYSNGLKAS